MRVTMVASIACSLLGFAAAPAHAGIPLGGLERDAPPPVEVEQAPVEVAQASVTSPGVGVPASVTPGTTAPNIASGSTAVGVTTPTTSLASPAPTAAGAPLTAGAITQSNAGQETLPSSALPTTTEPVPPTPSSIAPQPQQPTNGFTPQSGAPTSGGLFNQFDGLTPNQTTQGSINVAPVNQEPQPPSTNGGGNPNVPGWDHP